MQRSKAIASQQRKRMAMTAMMAVPQHAKAPAAAADQGAAAVIDANYGDSATRENTEGDGDGRRSRCAPRLLKRCFRSRRRRRRRPQINLYPSDLLRIVGPDAVRRAGLISSVQNPRTKPHIFA